MNLCQLTKVISHNNYKVALRDIADVYTFLEKLGDRFPQELNWNTADAAIEKHYSYLSHQGDFVFVNKDDSEIRNLISNLKVLDITEDFIIVVGYERFH